MFLGPETLIMGIIILIITILISVLSPLGILFWIFSFVRVKTKDKVVRKVSLVIQIASVSLTFLIGLIISLLAFMKTNMSYFQIQDIIIPLSILFGMIFIVALMVGIIIWESFHLRNKK